jgi:hypothetical protein
MAAMEWDSGNKTQVQNRSCDSRHTTASQCRFTKIGSSPETVDSEDWAREVTEDEQDKVNDNKEDTERVSLVSISDHLN